jgi:hypothetical protein
MGSAEEVGRNDPCPCGSGKKYKRCCLGSEADPAQQPRTTVPALVAAVLGLLIGAGVAMSRGAEDGAVVAVVGLIIAAGVYVFTNMPPPNKDSGSPGGINFGG